MTTLVAAKPLVAAALTRVSRAKSRNRERERSPEQQWEAALRVDEIDGRAVRLDAGAEYREQQSASRFRTRIRTRFAALVEDIRAGRYDLVILWEVDRASRELEEWAGFLNACRDHAVLIHVVTHRRTYDASIGRDWRALADDGTDAAYYSEKLSVNVKRGHLDSADRGRPPGRAPRGYARVYDPQSGSLAFDGTTGLWQQVPDDFAPVVREIIERIAARVPINEVQRDLAARGVELHRNVVRQIALNPAYAGLRPHHCTKECGCGSDTTPGRWTPIVPEATWSRAVGVLKEQRDGSLPGRVVWLLSKVGSCACGATGSWKGSTAKGGRQATYFCAECGTKINAADADEHVTALALGRLARPDAAALLLTRDTSGEADAARAEAAQARSLADQWTAKLRTTPPDAADAVLSTIADLNRQARAATRRAERLSTPAALEDWADALGNLDAVLERWEAASLPARKAVLRVVFERIELRKAAYRGHPAKERISHRWS